jgi:hypothetical protein
MGMAAAFVAGVVVGALAVCGYAALCMAARLDDDEERRYGERRS